MKKTRLLLSIFLCFISASLYANTVFSELYTLLDKNYWQWQGQDLNNLNGINISTQWFNSPLSPDKAAVELNRKFAQQFTQLQIINNTHLLTGVFNGVHWLASIRKASNGSQGFISLLALDNNKFNSSYQQQLLPSDVVLVRQNIFSDKKSLSQYETRLAPPQLLIYLSKQINKHGYELKNKLILGNGAAYIAFLNKNSQLTEIYINKGQTKTAFTVFGAY